MWPIQAESLAKHCSMTIRLLQLVAAEERCALAETEIRQEVSSEMASLLHDMEANYKVCTHPQLCASA